MQFDPFVIPFNIGLYFILIYAVVRSVRWFSNLSRPDKLRLQRGFFGSAFGRSLKEIFMESLIHRKILKANFRLGYMHMSLAFGWFLLILFGTIEADIFGTRHLNPPYKAIFFKFFNPDHGRTGFEAVYSFLMDLILAFILSGLILAVIKRFSSKVVGMKKTTKLKLPDKIALTSLWLIFPSRLIAESLTSGVYGTGSFLTGSLGSVLASFLPANQLAYPFWWLYSLSLGTFFLLLPVTRYMHIPTELFLIFARNSGIRTGDQSGAFTEIQTYSCSSCGICIDACQLNFSTGITNIQSAYLMKGIRNNEDVNDIAFNCLMCGRCDRYCPVGIELTPIRMIRRRAESVEPPEKSLWSRYFPDLIKIVNTRSNGHPAFSWLPQIKTEATEVLYYAGCMTHLTPAIKKAMIRILDASGMNYRFLDEAGGVCCGRPLMLAGKDKEARELINFNSGLIRDSGARILVTSCPICYKVFRESYYLEVELMHHTQFIKMLIDEDMLRLRFLRKKVVYHAPCDLGRGSGIYDEPKDVLRHVARLQPTGFDDDDSLCCGGSLGNTRISYRQKNKIAADAASALTKGNPEILATACPLCKKTFTTVTDTRVADIAEIVAEAIAPNPPELKKHVVKELYREPADMI
ncbi:MAG TPA: (Fe-S)-binding protein [Bacteroidales bacterium]|jgi:Fe-S oxidoreductase|nr:(Fe-S)-binding protein [Bacteroidales bacterium]OQB64949.1 MAG: Anaerobic glycerol-3-phosphate dehydrogenase subunit C [Bacteroidetes bacterium ADurb.Bin145]HOU01649.1 (Fe-S)-binding protein [Bacteroidales bacterium]HQK66907.1 (Fe-S)-binding protein [Bacteroidales bacterium]